MKDVFYRILGYSPYHTLPTALGTSLSHTFTQPSQPHLEPFMPLNPQLTFTPVQATCSPDGSTCPACPLACKPPVPELAQTLGFDEATTSATAAAHSAAVAAVVASALATTAIGTANAAAVGNRSAAPSALGVATADPAAAAAPSARATAPAFATPDNIVSQKLIPGGEQVALEDGGTRRVGSCYGAGTGSMASLAWPHMLITASLHDERVPFWIPARYVARLRGLLNEAIDNSRITQLQGRPLVQLGQGGHGVQEGRDGEQRTETDGRRSGQERARSREASSKERLNIGSALPVVLFETDMEAGHFSGTGAQGRLWQRGRKAAFLLASLTG